MPDVGRCGSGGNGCRGPLAIGAPGAVACVVAVGAATVGIRGADCGSGLAGMPTFLLTGLVITPEGAGPFPVPPMGGRSGRKATEERAGSAGLPGIASSVGKPGAPTLIAGAGSACGEEKASDSVAVDADVGAADGRGSGIDCTGRISPPVGAGCSGGRKPGRIA